MLLKTQNTIFFLRYKKNLPKYNLLKTHFQSIFIVMISFKRDKDYMSVSMLGKPQKVLFKNSDH